MTLEPQVRAGVMALPQAPAARLLRCTGVRRETADVKTFMLESAIGAEFGWLPGQYLTVNLETAQGPAARCYTISSIPADGLQITVKALPGGPVSNWLHDCLLPGGLLEAHGPQGGFTPEPGHWQKYLFLAAGSGITPLASITRALRVSGAPVDAVLLYSMRSPADAIFGAELRGIEASSGIRVELLPSTGGPGPRGRLDAAALAALVPDAAGREVFACGPAPYMAAVRGMLESAGCATARLHVESYDIAAHAPAPVTPCATPDTEIFSVEFAASGRTIQCPADTFVLDAALAAGIAVPSNCTLGMCGTCKSALLAGSVEMNHAGGIRPREIAAGKILLCCSKPSGDLVIDA